MKSMSIKFLEIEKPLAIGLKHPLYFIVETEYKGCEEYGVSTLQRKFNKLYYDDQLIIENKKGVTPIRFSVDCVLDYCQSRVRGAV